MADLNSIDEIESYLSSISGNSLLKDPRNYKLLKNAMDIVFRQRRTLLCFDIEAWELNNGFVTEIGMAAYVPAKQRGALIPVIKMVHILIKEHMLRRNGRFVANHSDQFNGKISYVMTQDEAVRFVQGILDHHYSQEDKYYLVGHGHQGDLSWLVSMGIRIPDDIQWLDTQSIYSATHGKKGASLTNALRQAEIPHALLHNAGNDAYYTLLLALRLSDPIGRALTHLDRPRDNDVVQCTTVEVKSKKAKKLGLSDLVEINDADALLNAYFN